MQIRISRVNRKDHPNLRECRSNGPGGHYSSQKDISVPKHDRRIHQHIQDEAEDRDNSNAKVQTDRTGANDKGWSRQTRKGIRSDKFQR